MGKVWEDEISVGFRRIKDSKRGAAALGLKQGVDHILEVSNSRVPLDDGDLQRSGKATVDEQALRGCVSYRTAYAVREHEDLQAQHDPGRRAKYLESAFNSERREVAKIVARAIRRKLKEG